MIRRWTLLSTFCIRCSRTLQPRRPDCWKKSTEWPGHRRTYPRERANKLLAAARRRIQAAGHLLLITSEAVAEDGGRRLTTHCKLCGTLFSEDRPTLEGTVALICDDCLYEISRTLPEAVGHEAI